MLCKPMLFLQLPGRSVLLANKSKRGNTFSWDATANAVISELRAGSLIHSSNTEKSH